MFSEVFLLQLLLISGSVNSNRSIQSGQVGRLRDEKKELQSSIAELLAFQARQNGGTVSRPSNQKAVGS